MSETEAQSDQSMEEILQSIKRIIADDNEEDGDNASTNAQKEEEAALSASEEEGEGADQGATGSDVLELKDIVEEGDQEPKGVSQPQAKDEAEQPAPQQDVLESIDESLKDTSDKTDKSEEGSQQDVLNDIDSLLSNEALQSSSQALAALKQQAHAESEQSPVSTEAPVRFRSGVTVEDLVVEALRPELKRWLNDNLPAIVERMVAAEIKKITGS
jgi:cell pole-organizing protein PopZ